jgi:hypothetical protein
MSKSKEEFDKVLYELKSSKTEEDILKHLTFIVKGFELSLYKEVISSNPYYKDLFIDIRRDVIENLENLKETINEEISTIDKNLRKDLAPLKLKELRSDCISLLSEVDKKISEIESI